MDSRARLASLTRRDNYYEAFAVGDVIRHGRGKTITSCEMALLTHLSMNTAQGHFNSHYMQSREFGRPILYGLLTASIVIGLASEDTSENGFLDECIDRMVFRAPVYEGDTLYAASEVLAKDDGTQRGTGLILWRHWGANQDGSIVAEIDRRVRIKVAASWCST